MKLGAGHRKSITAQSGHHLRFPILLLIYPDWLALYGAAMGPLQLTDLIGLDTGESESHCESTTPPFGGLRTPSMSTSQQQRRSVTDGGVGRKPEMSACPRILRDRFGLWTSLCQKEN